MASMLAFIVLLGAAVYGAAVPALKSATVVGNASVLVNGTFQLAPRELSEPSIRLFRLAAHYAAAAYCPIDKHPTYTCSQRIHCAAYNCPTVEDAKAHVFFSPRLPMG